MKRMLYLFILLNCSLVLRGQYSDMYINGVKFTNTVTICNDTCLDISFVAHDDLTDSWAYWIYDSWSANPIANPTAPYLLSSNQTHSTICFNSFDTGYLYMMAYSIGEWNHLNDHPDTIKGFLELVRIVPCKPNVSINPNILAACTGACVDFETLNENSPNTWSWLSTGPTQNTAVGSSTQICYDEPGSYLVRCIALNSVGSDTDYTQIEIYEKPSIIMPNDTSLCSETGFLIEAQTSNANQWSWSTGETSESISVFVSGKYRFWASNDYCSVGDSISVKIASLPQFYWEDNLQICSDEPLKISVLQQDSTEYLWSNGSTYPDIVVDSTGIYTVQLSNFCGTIKKEVAVEVKDCACLMFIPNTFTPDGNNENEIFKPAFDCRLQEYKMYIYNRWGQLIFTTSDPLYGWNGQFEGKPAPMDVYVALIKYAGLDVKNLLRKESRYVLTLLR